MHTYYDFLVLLNSTVCVPDDFVRFRDFFLNIPSEYVIRQADADRVRRLRLVSHFGDSVSNCIEKFLHKFHPKFSHLFNDYGCSPIRGNDNQS